MTEEDQEEREEKANSIVRNYLWAGAAGGILPIPLLDLALISGIQFKMVHSLAKHYEVDFSGEVVRSSIAALIGGGTVAISTVLLSTAGILGVAGTAAAGGGTTYALGKVFIMHFESGGTLLTFDPEKVRAEYEKQLQEGKRLLSLSISPEHVKP